MDRAWPGLGKLTLVVMALAAFVLAGTDASAKGGGGGRGKSGHSGGKSGSHHSRGTHHFNRSGSAVFYGGYWAGPAYWLAQNVEYQPAEPVRFIERSLEESAQSAWYYCESAAAYFPYVTECAGVWVEIAPFTVTP